MKKYLSIFVLMVGAVFLCTNVNATAKNKAPSYDKVYDKVISDYYNYVANYSDNSPQTEKYSAFADIADLAGEDALEAIGYTIKDVTGDKVPELIFGFVVSLDGKKSYGKQILALYTIAKGNPKLVFYAGDGNNYYYNVGSGKFAFSGQTKDYEKFGKFSLSKSGDKLVWSEFKFADFTDIDNIVLYSNKTGSMDKKSSKKQAITQEKFEDMIVDELMKFKDVEFTPLTKYKKNAPQKQKISVYYEKDAKSKYKNYERYAIKSGTPEEKIFIVPSGNVKDFKLFKLESTSVSDSGKVSYDKKVLYSVKTLTPQKPLLADIEYFPTIPSCGISFVNSSGKVQKYIITQSGEDGSLQIYPNDF